MTSARSVLRALAVLGCVLAVGGCSFEGSVGTASAGPSSGTGSAATGTAAPSSTPPPSTGTSAAGSTTPDPGSTTDRCHSGDLVGRLATEDSSAGHRHAAIELRNISGRACQVAGYGGIELVDEYGQGLPTEQVRVSAPAPAVVTVAPGGTATSQLTWASVPGDADAVSGPCQPLPTTLSVIPPDETQPLALPWDLGPVCQGGTVQQQAYR